MDRIHMAHDLDDLIGGGHAHKGVDDAQREGEEEGEGHLPDQGPPAHGLGGAQLGEQLIPPGVVRRLAQLLEGQHRRGGEEEHQPQIEAHVEHQDLGPHQVVVVVQLEISS